MKKTEDQRQRERLRHYRSEYARLKARLRAVGFICEGSLVERWMQCGKPNCACASDRARQHGPYFQLSWKEKSKRSEEHTSELQSHVNLVCRLLLEKKKKKKKKKKIIK